MDHIDQRDNDAEDSAYIFSIGNGDKLPDVKLSIANQPLLFKIDTGSAVNVLDEEGSKLLRPMPKLDKDVKPTYGYSSEKPLAVMGKFSMRVTCNRVSTVAEFYVIRGKYGRLLNYKKSGALKLIQLLNTVKAAEPAKPDTGTVGQRVSGCFR